MFRTLKASHLEVRQALHFSQNKSLPPPQPRPLHILPFLDVINSVLAKAVRLMSWEIVSLALRLHLLRPHVRLQNRRSGVRNLVSGRERERERERGRERGGERERLMKARYMDKVEMNRNQSSYSNMHI